MAEKHTYDYSSGEIEPGTGTVYVRTDDTVLHFKDSKAEKNYLLGRGACDLERAEVSRRVSGRVKDNQISGTERIFVMVKSDDIQHGLIGDIVSHSEDHGLKMVAGRFMQIDEEFACDHYGEHEGKFSSEGLVDFVTSGPVLVMVWEGQSTTRQVRRVTDETDPAESAPGTIRGDYGPDFGRNVVHGFDHEDEGANEYEIVLFFDEDKLVDYERADEIWLCK